MDIRTQSTLLAAILGMALGLSMLLRPTRSREVTRYSTFALIVGGYYLALFLDQVVPPNWRWLAQVSISGSLILGALVPSAALSFFLEFLQVRPTVLRNGQRVAFLSAIFGLAVGLTPLSNAFWARVALSAWVLISLTVSVSLLARR
ncbi:MAG TPA: histidine kinase, partial [Myxococcaceae bacterium]|nr:histidine kinase [Myxococcaceae bacterium]